MKKIGLLFLILVLALTIFSMPAAAGTYGDLYYYISNDEVYISSCKTSASGTITIPSTINGKPVTHIAQRAFISCANLTSVNIPSSVVSIENTAFDGCTGITSITIPSSVVSIGGNAFDGCTKLTSVTIPNSVTYFGGDVFNNTPWLTARRNDRNDHLVIVNGYLIDGQLFSGTNLLIPNNVKLIADGALANRTGLTSVTLPNSIKIIGGCAFYGCTGLTEVTIPSSVTSIGSGAFSNCTNAKITLKIGKAVETDYTYDTYKNQYWNSIRTEINSIEFEDNVTKIGTTVFSGCTGLTSVTIPNGVESIGGSAFSQCTDLTSITIGKGVKSIGSNAFAYCTKLEKVNITDIAAWCKLEFSGYSDNPLYYAHNLYLNDEKVTSLEITEGVTKIKGYAFYNCTSIESVSIPDSVESIGDSAFSSCSNLTKVNISDLAAWCKISLGSISANPLYIAHSLYLNNNLVIDLVIPEGITKINDYTFYGCKPIKTITVSGSIKSIGQKAFFDCTGLKSATIPSSVTSFGSDVFNTINLTIYGSIGSKAEEYANINGFDFIDLTTIVNSVSLNPTNLNLVKGNSATIQATVSPSTAINKTVSWKSSNPAVATVDSVGKVSAVAAGSATITVTTADGNKIATCLVTVTAGTTPTPTPTPTPTVSFNDVKSTDYFAVAVNWAVAKGITSGTSATTFSPNATCTRAQTVTFIWRAAGQPEPKSTYNPFTDVKASDYYYKAVLWAVEQGITSGTSKTTFSPNAGCTRGQVVTFLWRANGQPSVTTSNPFVDVIAGQYYYTAVLWAVAEGVTSGTSATTFSPNAICIRGQIVTFLYRNYK